MQSYLKIVLCGDHCICHPVYILQAPKSKLSFTLKRETLEDMSMSFKQKVLCPGHLSGASEDACFNGVTFCVQLTSIP